jgi:hypothetical protein
MQTNAATAFRSKPERYRLVETALGRFFLEIITVNGRNGKPSAEADGASQFQSSAINEQPCRGHHFAKANALGIFDANAH